MEITPKNNVKIMSKSSSSYLNLLNKELSGFPKLLSAYYFPLFQWVYSHVKSIKGKKSPIVCLK